MFEDIHCSHRHSPCVAILARNDFQLRQVSRAGVDRGWIFLIPLGEYRLCRCSESTRCQTPSPCAAADVEGNQNTQKATNSYLFSAVEGSCSFCHLLTSIFTKLHLASVFVPALLYLSSELRILVASDPARGFLLLGCVLLRASPESLCASRGLCRKGLSSRWRFTTATAI